MKKEDKERRRQEAVHRDMPVTVLLCIITVTTLFLSGLDGEKKVNGLTLPAIELSPKDATWTKKQVAKITRWACAMIEKYGFSPDPSKHPGAWRSAQEKIRVLGKTLDRYLPQETCYGEARIAQLAVLEVVWRGVMTLRKETRQEAIWLRTTMTTLTDRFVEVESPLDWAITDTYMEVTDYLTGQA